MKTLNLYIANKFAGQFEQLTTGQIAFTYDPDYIGPNVSVAMRKEDSLTFAGNKVLAWLSNLLPDDQEVRDGMAAYFDYKGSNVFRLIADYGMDLPGAMSITPTDASATNRSAAYQPTTEHNIAQRLKNLIAADKANAKRSWMRGNERWSLAGAQTKIALHEYNGNYYECLNGAPSTVIIKPDAASIEMQALCECVCLDLAKRCGLPAADVSFHTFDDVDAICVKRYDRIVRDINHVEIVHQEDMCQALGKPPSQKYAQEGGPSASGCVKTLQAFTTNTDVSRFLDYIAFNYAMGNIDAHGKNYSMVHLNSKDVQLAPLYDVCSILPYTIPKETYTFAMPLGNENRLGRVSRTNLARFAKACMLEPQTIVDKFDNMAELVRDNIETSINDFAPAKNIDNLASTLVPRTTTFCNAIISSMQPGAHAYRGVDLYSLITKEPTPED